VTLKNILRAYPICISGDLFGNEIGDLIGWEQFDLIREVVENSSALKRAVTEAIQKARDAEEERKAPSHGTSFSINTVSEKKQKKKEQKDRRKAKGVIGTIHFQSSEPDQTLYLRDRPGVAPGGRVRRYTGNGQEQQDLACRRRLDLRQRKDRQRRRPSPRIDKKVFSRLRQSLYRLML